MSNFVIPDPATHWGAASGSWLQMQAAGLNGNNERLGTISSFQNRIPAASARRRLSLLNSLGKVCQEPTAFHCGTAAAPHLA